MVYGLILFFIVLDSFTTTINIIKGGIFDYMIYYISLQVFQIIFYLISIVKIYNLRNNLFSIDPIDRKNKYQKISILFFIIGFILILNFLVFYSLWVQSYIESIFGEFSFIDLILSISFRIGIILYFLGIGILFVIRFRKK